MIVKKVSKSSIVIDLTGPDGNVFALMGWAKRLAGQLDLDGGAIVRDMMASDYEHAVKVFDGHFGEFVVLER